MKTTRVLSVLFFGMLVGASLFAQTVQFFVLGKEQRFDQTNTATVTPTAVDVPNGQYPWRIFTEANGSGLTATTPASLLTNLVTTPGGSIATYSLTWDTNELRWKSRTGFASQGLLDASYANGTYSVSLNNGSTTAFTLDLGATNHYPNTPIGTLTGGNWVGGVYQFIPGNTLTIDSGTYNTDFLYSTARVEINIDGNSFTFQKDKGFGSATPFLNTDFSGSVSATSAEMPTFIAGQTYNVDISYNYVVYGADISSAFGQSGGSATGVALFGVTTSFQIQAISAIPEPSTYAAIFGAVTLAGVMLHRRRRLA